MHRSNKGNEHPYQKSARNITGEVHSHGKAQYMIALGPSRRYPQLVLHRCMQYSLSYKPYAVLSLFMHVYPVALTTTHGA